MEYLRDRSKTKKLLLLIPNVLITVLTLIGFVTAINYTNYITNHKFEEETEKITSQVSDQINDYSNILDVAASYITNYPTASNKNWQSFFSDQDMFNKYPSLSSIAYIHLSESNNSTQINSDIDKYFDGITIKSDGEYFSKVPIIVRIASKNKVDALLGQNFYTNEDRRVTAEKAIITKSTQATPVIKLLTGYDGFLLLKPVFGKNKAIGLVAVSFRLPYDANELFSSYSKDGGMKIIDVTEQNDLKVIADNDFQTDSKLVRNDLINFTSRKWRIYYSMDASRYTNRLLPFQPYGILVLGLLINILFIVTANARAMKIKLTPKG